MGTSPELIDGERFVRAWKRFREKFPEDELNEDHRDMLQQGIGVERDFVQALTAISTEATSLFETKCSARPQLQYRIPRPSDILKTRMQRAVANTATAETTAPSSQPLPVIAAPSTETNPANHDEGTMMDFSYDDLKAMLDTKELAEKNLSTQEIRRRLGLQDRDIASQTTTSESKAHEEQESIQADMANLAKTLKEHTKTINQTLVDDVKILDAVGQSAESNADKLDRENAVLKQQLASSIGLWTSLWLVMGAVMVFMATYIFMKLFSRRHF